jgi:DNA-binding response OmpR family regulator
LAGGGEARHGLTPKSQCGLDRDAPDGAGGLMIFVFKNFELDEELYELRRKSVALRLEPKAFDVLLHLVRHGDHVV